MRIFRILTVFLLIASCLACQTTPINPIQIHDPTIKVMIKMPDGTAESTGFIVHSSAKYGTYILTTRHTVVQNMITDTFASIVMVYDKVDILDEAGQITHADVVAVGRVPLIQNEKYTLYVDLALIHEQYVGTEIDRHINLTPLVAGQPLTMRPFSPRDAPYTAAATYYEKQPDIGETLISVPPVEAGNSGSALYDAEYNLVGVVWGRGMGMIMTDKGIIHQEIGLFINATEIDKFLRAQKGLGWYK